MKELNVFNVGCDLSSLARLEFGAYEAINP
jgi:hypothetical protein